jgi:hypothetical protein
MPNMKRLLLAAFFCIAIFGPALCQTQTGKEPPFSLTLSALTPSAEAGQRIELKIVLRNLTNHDLEYQYDIRNYQDRSNNFDVWDASGKKLEPIKKHNPQIGDTFEPVSPHVVKPGETETSGVTITLIYDMTKPGTYTIQGCRKVSGQTNDRAVRSNKITVTVVAPLVPAPAPPHKRASLNFVKS